MSSRYFCNKDCEYYPCHTMAEDMNCLFCYCPLYHLEDCGGSYTITGGGVKACDACIYPHIPSNYDKIVERLSK